MTNMQMTVGFGRKARHYFIMLTGFEILHDNITYKIADGWGRVVIQ